VLAVLGLLVFVVSYVLLPWFVTYCFGSCSTSLINTLWQASMPMVSQLRADIQGLPDPQFVVALLSDASKDSVFFVLDGLPLLAAVTVVGCSVGFLVRPHRALAVWGQRAWRVGTIALVLMLLWSLVVVVAYRGGPSLGFVGQLVGYGLLWAGNRIVLTARP
jgi:hypothetical protein